MFNRVVKRVGFLVLLLSVFGAWPHLFPQRQEGGEGADRVQSVLATIESNHSLGRTQAQTFILQENDINAFLGRQLAREAPRGLESVRVDLQDSNQFLTSLIVNLDGIDLSGSQGSGVFESLFSSVFSGPQELEVEGQIETFDGKATYKVLGGWLNGVPVPATVFDMVLKNVGARLRPPFNPTEPFELKWGIRELKVNPDTVTILTGR